MPLPHYPLPKEVSDDVYAALRAVGTSLWSRPKLAGRDRAMVSVAATAALGQLTMVGNYIRAGRSNFGLSREEICEVILQIAPYAGTPTALDALGVAKHVFDEEDQAVEESS